MKKTALYIRVSTNAQFEEGYSVEAQQKKLRAWCEIHDIENFEFYIDGGYSGSNLNRPEIRRLIKEIKNGEIDRVAVYKLDRISRSQKDTVYLLEDVFEPNGTGFVSLNESFDTTTPYGKAMVGILSVFAQLERENIRERTRLGMNERIQKGFWQGGGHAPYGYDYDREKGILIPNENAQNVEMIYRMYLSGYTSTKLADVFGFKGDKQILDILSRKTYLGVNVYNGEEINGLHVPLVSNELWEKVQKERAKRSRGVSLNSKYLLSGIVFCGRCGARMRYQKWSNGVKIYCYSQQKSRKNLVHDPSCDNPRIDASELEKFVTDDLLKFSIEYSKKNSPRTKTSVKDVLKTRQKTIETKIKNLYNLYSESPNDILLNTIEENKKELDDIMRKIENEKDKAVSKEELLQREKTIRSVNEGWDEMTDDEKRAVIRECIKKVTVYGERVDIQYNF